MIKQILLGSALISSSFLFAIKANAIIPNYDQIYVFGDSLSDTGNTFNFTGGNIPPSPPYFQGRSSNELNWIDYLSQDLGISPLPTFFDVSQGANPSNGVNFAFTGALTGTFITGDDMTTPEENTLPPTFPPLVNLPFPLIGLQSQVGLFAQNFALNANPNALYLVFAGANDYLPTSADVNLFRPLTETNSSISNLSQAINNLVGLGAKNILVANLPDLGLTPRSLNTSNPSFYTNLSDSHNQSLTGVINNLQSALGNNVDLDLLDIDDLFSEIVSNPNNFGFTNINQGCLLVGCTNPDQFLFWDNVHPTTNVHRQIADLAIATIDEPIPEATPESNSLIAFFSLVGLAVVLKKSK